MDNEKYQKPNCDECEQDFDNNIKNIVDEVDGYNRKDHRAKKHEVEEAFEQQDAK